MPRNRKTSTNGCLLPESVPVPFDRAGRRLEPWPAGRYRLRRDQLWLFADNPRSWDSRYWGPGSTADIRALALPLLVFPPFRSTSGERGCGAAPLSVAASAPGLSVCLRIAVSPAARDCNLTDCLRRFTALTVG